FLINNCGQIINQWSSEYLPGHSVYILPNGNLIRAGKKGDGNISFGGIGGIVEMFDWNGDLLWEFVYSNEEHRLHHDIYPLQNGNLLVLAATLMSNEEALLAGRDPNLISSEGVLYNEQILEIKPIGTNDHSIEWEWNFNDHLIQDFDNTKNNYGVVEEHPEKLDINFLNNRDPHENWLHVNSIQYDETLDQIVISSRNLSELYIIDHSTTTEEASGETGGTYGKGGDFLYRWGNPASYGQGNEDDRVLYGQHFPHIIKPGLKDEGKIILFNNGIERDPFFSEIMIFSTPTTSPGFYNYTPNSSYGPEAPEFIYESNEENDFSSNILSGATRLPNDNILICDGNSGRIFEINSTNDIVWDYIIPVNNSTGEISSQGDVIDFNNLTFRGIKYSAEYEGFVGKDVTPSDPIELYSTEFTCSSLSTDDLLKNNITIYPNPVIDFININTSLNILEVDIYDVLGKSLNFRKINNRKIDMSNFNRGIYVLKIKTEIGIITKKIIIY
ncbi:aryl-sulfate sulfotransferase, partial [Flavobacteriaceae bacterium]|nr:aryl-sulfate sulfotransferase [Flavobacteriaceae bacterium]